MRTNRRERWLDAARKAVGRAAGPVFVPRHGWGYVGRRAVAAQLVRLSRAGTGPAFTEVAIEEIERWRPGARVHEVHGASRERFHPPRVHTDRPWLLGAKPLPLVIDTPPMRVLDVPGGMLFGADGVPGLSTDVVVADVPTVFPVSRARVRRRADLARRSGVVPLDGTTVSLLQHSPPNHAHWLLQGIPRLDLVSRVVHVTAADRVLVNAGAPPVVRAALDALGVSPDRVVEVPEPAPCFECERLVVATPPPPTAVLADWARAFVRSLLLDPAACRDGHGPRRVFVTRSETAKRRMVNRAEVVAALESRGFEVAEMEGRPVSEQAAIFAGAECVVAEHGAGLANLAFAPAGCRVVELMGANTLSWTYSTLSSRTGLRHEVLLGTEPAPPPALWSWQIDADQVVDVGRLVAIVDRL